jgi:amino-acid N-acetyltransferase
MPGKGRKTDGPAIRKAVIADVPAIQALVNHFANEHKMLSRSLSEIYENVRDFFVIEDRGAVVGSAALHVFWSDLAEVRALAVAERYQHQGLGKRLVAACRREAEKMGIKRMFCLTFQDAFFRQLGFTPISKDELPHKVWSDCIKCPMFPNCDEIALIFDLDAQAKEPEPAGRKR